MLHIIHAEACSEICEVTGIIMLRPVAAPDMRDYCGCGFDLYRDNAFADVSRESDWHSESAYCEGIRMLFDGTAGKGGQHLNSKVKMALALISTMLVIGTAFFAGLVSFPAINAGGMKASSSVSATANTAFTYPTTTMKEPGYTNGTYVMAATNDVQHLNIYATSDLYSFYLIGEVYDSLYNLLPNQTISPWLATGYVAANDSAHPGTTTDPLTGLSTTYNYTYNVTLRPGVQWSDWTPANSGNTYKYDGVTMNTHTVQSADVVISWLMLQSSADFTGTYLNVVNVLPVTNLTVEFFLSDQSATFATTTLLNPILPYHVWVQHDWATNPGTGVWNYTGQPNGYDVWNMNYSSTSYTASGMVGTGPFMFSSGYGMPAGQWIPGVSWNMYVNPHYFVQYVPALEQFTPKIFEILVPLFGSESAAVTALTLGQVDTIEGGVAPTFISTINAAQNTFIYYHPGSGYGFMQFNTYPTQNAPFNITAFRQALNYAVDKTYIASVIDQGYVVPGDSIIPLSDSIWHNFSLPQYNYNPALTEQMIANITGMKEVNGVWQYFGKPVKANIEITTSSSNPLGVEAAQLIASEWTSLGIPTVVTQVSFIKLVADLIISNFNSIALGITGITGDPTSFLTAVYNNQAPTLFYQGPFSNITYQGKIMNGNQVQNLLNNLTNRLNIITNLRERIAIADQIQGIAALESTEVIFGYGVDIYPFYNGTFTGITETSLPQAAMIAFTFDSVHLKGQVIPKAPTTIPKQLRVGVVASKSVYFDGQYGNLTIQVRDQYGQAMSGVGVSVGYNPTGGVLNVSSTSGVTNSAGQYMFEFKVFNRNQGMFTSDYAGSVNFSVAAFSNGQSGILPGLGYVHVSTAPMPVEYAVSSAPTALVNGSSQSIFRMTVIDPQTGLPISGYSYALSALSGAVLVAPTSVNQSVSQGNTYNFLLGSGYLSVNSSGATDWNVTTITGVTGSNGTISVGLSVNSSVNFAQMGRSFLSYLFLGDYSSGGAMTGAAPYVSIAELTSSSSPHHFGSQQPVEIPLQVQQTASSSKVKIALTTSSSTLSPNGQSTVTVVVTNSSTGLPIPNYAVTLTSQNALGANRGYLFGSNGMQVQSFNPNEYFGSSFIPGMVVVTNATGVASATFSPSVYTTQYSNNGAAFAGYSAAPYTDSRLIPFDEFQISAAGAAGGVNSTTTVSTQTVTNAVAVPVLSAYVGGASILNGVNVIAGNASYTLYVNSTEDTAAGPNMPNVNVNVSVSLGSVGGSTYAIGSTGSGGSFSVNLVVPNVSVMTPIFIKVSYVSGGKTFSTETIYYAMPHYSLNGTTITTKTVYKNQTSTAIPAYMYGALGLFVVLTALFGILYMMSRGGRGGSKNAAVRENKPPQN